MAKGIRDSDSVPTPRDGEVGEEFFYNPETGNYDQKKMSAAIARLYRKELHQSDVQNRMDETLTSMDSKVNMLEGKIDLHIQQSSEHQHKVMTTIEGDGTPFNRGIVGAISDCNESSNDVKCMVSELTTRLTGKPPTTDRHKKKDEALEPSEPTKYVYIGIGIIAAVVFFTGSLIAVWPYIRGE